MPSYQPAIGQPNLLASSEYGYRISNWGDSRADQNWTTSNNIPFPLAGGDVWWLEALTFGAVRMDIRYNFGVGGDRPSDLLFRMVNDVPNEYGVRPSQVPPSVARVLIGTNAINGAFAEGLAISQLALEVGLILKWLTDRGHFVLLIAEWPRGDSSSNTLVAGDIPLMLEYRKALFAFQSLPNVEVIDPFAKAIDTARSDLRPQEGMLRSDGLHNGPGIAYLTAAEGAPRLWWLPPPNLAPCSNADLYNVDTQPTGCMNSNPMVVQGAGGTLGANATGVVPEGYTLSTNDAGVTVVGSFVTVNYRGRKRPAFRMTVSGTAGGEGRYVQLRQSGLMSETEFRPGDRCYGGAEVVVSDNHANLLSVTPMVDPGISGSRIWGGSVITDHRGMPSQAVQGFEAMPLTIEENIDVAATSAALDLRIFFGEATTCAAVVDLVSFFTRKVI